MRKILLFPFCLVLLSLAACSTVTVTKDSNAKSIDPPSHEERQNFFLWGLAPERIGVDIKGVCGRKAVRQIQTQRTFADGLLAAITVGLYSPRTMRIWCE